MTPRRRAALYARGQDAESQLQSLREVAARAAWETVECFVDGDTAERHALERLLSDAKHHRFNIVAAWSADSLGSTLAELVRFLNSLKVSGCDLHLSVPPVDTTAADGKAIFKTADIFAELERVIRQARIRKGRAQARADGKKFGRPRLDPHKVAEICSRADSGQTGKAIATELGVSERAVWKVLAARP